MIGLNEILIQSSFSFKNCQLMSVTESLYCRLDRREAKPNTYAQMLGFANSTHRRQFTEKVCVLDNTSQ